MVTRYQYSPVVMTTGGNLVPVPDLLDGLGGGESTDRVYRVTNSATVPPTPTGGRTEATYTPTAWHRTPPMLDMDNQFLWATEREGRAAAGLRGVRRS